MFGTGSQGSGHSPKPARIQEMFGEHPEAHGGIPGDGPMQGQELGSSILVGFNSGYSMVFIFLDSWQSCRSGSEQQVEAEGHVSQRM